MAKNHRELICWQLSAKLRSLVLKYTHSGGASKDYDFTRQIRRAARSACYQTSEGFYFFKHKRFAQYLDGAYASLGEVVDQLEDGLESRHFTKEECIEMRRLAKRALKATHHLAAWLRSHPDPE